MYSQRDWFIEKMGIMQYVLHRPSILKGIINTITLTMDTKLLIITDNLLSLKEPIVSDVLFALNLHHNEVQIFKPEQFLILPQETYCNSWHLGVNIPVHVSGIKITSPVLAELYHNSNAKKSLWQQICKYESDFFPKNKRY